MEPKVPDPVFYSEKTGGSGAADYREKEFISRRCSGNCPLPGRRIKEKWRRTDWQFSSHLTCKSRERWRDGGDRTADGSPYTFLTPQKSE